MAERRRLGDILLDSKKISMEQLEEAIEYQRTNYVKVGEALVELGFLTSDEIVDTLSYQMGIQKINIDRAIVDVEVVRSIPKSVAQRYTVLPLYDEEGKMVVATSNPFDFNAFDDIRFITKKEVTVRLAHESEIRKAIDVYYTKESGEKALAELEEQFVVDIGDDDEMISDVENAPTVRLVNSIINQAITMKASDVHIEPFEQEVMVRIRIDGVLQESMRIPLHTYSAVSTRFKIMAGMNIAERRIPQDGRIEMTSKGLSFDLRVSSLPTVFGEKIVLRILDRSGSIRTRQELGFTESENEHIDKFQRVPFGIVLVSGPTGSGKSTTLYTLLNEQNDVKKNIVTIEDPVEYMINGINQVHVNNKAGMTFAAGLRSILRQDPDTIMIGEIRDEETAEIAVRSAITGHMVFSTIHTNDAASSVTRLVDMGVPGYLVADALVGVIAQRLIRKLCPHCAKKVNASTFDQRILDIDHDAEIYEAVGCGHCNKTGYAGRIAIHEVLVMDEDMKEIITNGGSSEKLKRAALERGMKTLKDNCKKHVLSGTTSVQEMMKSVFT